MRNSQQPESSVRNEMSARQTRTATDAASPSVIPFAERVTCTVAAACQATGLGRTKLYELIGAGKLATTTIGRRRLVLVRSLRHLLRADGPEAEG
jgi:excisionase family DNA binding protein